MTGLPVSNPPIAAPRSTAKLALLNGFKEKRQEAQREALTLLQEFRKDPSLYKHSAADLYHIMESAGHNRGSGNLQSHNLIAEFKYLLNAQRDLSVDGICRVLGIGSCAYQELRRRDVELDQMVRDYQATFFEEEAMTMDKGLHPALTIFGLKARAGWMDAKDRAITIEQLTALTEQFMQIVKEELVAHPEILDRIAKRLGGEPLEAKVDAIR